MAQYLHFEYFSDGRVSESMASLIKNLLVLNPHNRLKTDQVLESLQTIFAVTTLTADEPLQVRTASKTLDDI